MPKKSLIKGGYISDDYYFVFTDDGIELLKNKRNISGDFVCYSNSLPNTLLYMTLLVKIVGYGKTHKSTNVDINFEKKSVIFEIDKNDFYPAFIQPTDHIKAHGPDWRFASCNYYVYTKESRKFELQNNIIDQLINQARAGKS